MPIDWFTVVAQAVNFLILVWLLKRFLYKPILNAIDEREKGIAAQLADAEAKKAEAKLERDEFQQKNAAFDKDVTEKLKRATDEAGAERQRLLDQARADADALRLKRQESLQNEQLHLADKIARWTQKEVVATTRKALADLATAGLEERMVDAFVQRLRELPAEKKEQLTAALKKSGDSIRVRSAFDLPIAQQGVVETAVKETFATEIQFQFETVAELVCGIELVTDGQKITWSVTDYLATLEKNIDQLLQSDAPAISQQPALPKPADGPESKTSTEKVNH